MAKQAEDFFLDSDAISDEFFIEIVESKLKLLRKEFKLRLVMLSPAIGKNENFVSVVYRAKIKVELLEAKEMQSVDVIIKALCNGHENFQALGVFQRERFLYENILRKFEKIWLEAGEEIQFGPKCFKVDQDPFEVLVLEDLKSERFVMADRKIGFDIKQTKFVLKKLARFHAAGASFYQQVRHFCLHFLLSHKISSSCADENNRRLLEPRSFNEGNNAKWLDCERLLEAVQGVCRGPRELRRMRRIR